MLKGIVGKLQGVTVYPDLRSLFLTSQRKAARAKVNRLPHEGAKQREKAKRLRMEPNFPNGLPRSAPIVVRVA